MTKWTKEAKENAEFKRLIHHIKHDIGTIYLSGFEPYLIMMCDRDIQILSSNRLLIGKDGIYFEGIKIQRLSNDKRKYVIITKGGKE